MRFPPFVAMVLLTINILAAAGKSQATFITFDPPGSILTTGSSINAAGTIAG
jgi:hypothetical protein